MESRNQSTLKSGMSSKNFANDINLGTFVENVENLIQESETGLAILYLNFTEFKYVHSIGWKEGTNPQLWISIGNKTIFHTLLAKLKEKGIRMLKEDEIPKYPKQIRNVEMEHTIVVDKDLSVTLPCQKMYKESQEIHGICGIVPNKEKNEIEFRNRFLQGVSYKKNYLYSRLYFVQVQDTHIMFNMYKEIMDQFNLIKDDERNMEKIEMLLNKIQSNRATLQDMIVKKKNTLKHEKDTLLEKGSTILTKLQTSLAKMQKNTKNSKLTPFLETLITSHYDMEKVDDNVTKIETALTQLRKIIMDSKDVTCEDVQYFIDMTHNYNEWCDQCEKVQSVMTEMSEMKDLKEIEQQLRKKKETMNRKDLESVKQKLESIPFHSRLSSSSSSSTSSSSVAPVASAPSSSSAPGTKANPWKKVESTTTKVPGLTFKK